MIEVLIIIGVVGAFLGVSEAMAWRKPLQKNIQRKVVHIGACLLLAILALRLSLTSFVIAGFFFTFVMVLSRKIYPLKSLEDRSSRSYGEVFLPLGVALASFLANSSHAFIAALLILGLADTCAYFIGRSFSSRIIIFQKTIYGSSAFFITSLLLLEGLYGLHGSAMLVIISLLATFVELGSPKGSDNLTIPVTVVVMINQFTSLL